MWIVILNFESESVDCLDLVNKPKDMEVYDFVEEVLEYSLSNCHWFVKNDKPIINFLN
jgi:hypothetical protein